MRWTCAFAPPAPPIPVASVSLAAFASYYAKEAEAWEFLAMTRARPVWSSSPELRHASAAKLISRPPFASPVRSRPKTAKAVLEMRNLIAKELPATGFWDMKRSPGGLIDIEFAAQYLQIAHASRGGPLSPNTGLALRAFENAGLAPQDAIRTLFSAWRLQQDLAQLLRVGLDRDDSDPSEEPAAFRDLLAQAGRRGGASPGCAPACVTLRVERTSRPYRGPGVGKRRRPLATDSVRAMTFKDPHTGRRERCGQRGGD